MLYRFYDDWDDIEKFESEWCRRQARLLNQNTREECYPIRRGKITEILQEMAKKDYATATSATINLMEHLLYILIAPNNDAKNHWIGEIGNFLKLFRDGVGVSKINKNGNTNIKNNLAQEWQKSYEKARRKVINKARLSKPGTFMTYKIPLEPPWGVEDFLTKSISELSDV